MGRTHRRTGAPDIRRHPSEADLPFGISLHAVEQACARVFASGTSIARARVELRILARSAVRTEERTGNGEEIWVATDGAPIRFVVATRGGVRMCVTVLEDDKEAC